MPYLLYIILGYVFYVLSIMVHVLIMNQKISYKLVNGGRSESFEKQYKLSMMSLIILALGLLIVVIYHIYPQIATTLFGMLLMGMLSLYWLMSFVMQLLGTSFEKKVMSLIVFIGLFSHVMLCVSYFVN